MASYSHCLLAALVSLASLSGIAQSNRNKNTSHLLARDLEKNLSAMLSGEFQTEDSVARLEEVKDVLWPMFVSLPKDEYGRLSHSVVCYALHRYFLNRYSWYIRGLVQSDDSKVEVQEIEINNIFAYGVVPVFPAAVQSMMEKRHEQIGLNLHELAIVAVTLEDAATNDVSYRLDHAYKLIGAQEREALTSSQFEEMLAVFTTVYMDGEMALRGLNITWIGFNSEFRSLTTLEVNVDLVFKSKRYAWIKKQLQAAHAKVDAQDNFDKTQMLDFNLAVAIAQSFIRDLGKYNSDECHVMKHVLLGMEGRKPGRVRLSDFYNASRSGAWLFKEDVDYLRVIGALDESNTSNLQVIVPNYVASMPQCLMPSGLYLLCCPNECESVLSVIENAVGSTEAAMEQVVKLIPEIATDTEKASPETPREVSAYSLEQLASIAYLHGGVVPIHGRLFAQWLHHVFPRECPYPHESGNDKHNPLTPGEWLQMTGQATEASEEMMMSHIRPDDTCSADGSDCDDSLPWTNSEELLVSTFSSSRTQTRYSKKSKESKLVTTRAVHESFLFWSVMATIMYYSFATRGIICKSEKNVHII